MDDKARNNPLRSDYTGDSDASPMSRPAKLVVGGALTLFVGLWLAGQDPFGVLVAVIGALLLLAGFIGYATHD